MNYPVYDHFLEVEEFPNGLVVESDWFNHTDWICEIEEWGWPVRRWAHWHDKEWPYPF